MATITLVLGIPHETLLNEPSLLQKKRPLVWNFAEMVFFANKRGLLGLAFASGSATTATITNMLASGSHLISVNDVYGGTFRYFTKVANTNGVQVTFVDMSSLDNVKKAIKSNTKVI